MQQKFLSHVFYFIACTFLCHSFFVCTMKKKYVDALFNASEEKLTEKELKEQALREREERKKKYFKGELRIFSDNPKNLHREQIIFNGSVISSGFCSFSLAKLMHPTTNSIPAIQNRFICSPF